MRALLFVVVALSLATPTPALAQKKKPGSSDGGKVDIDAKGNKSKTYSFTGLDIDGKLKTPQLLYFLNRMKSEFDTTAPNNRSFIRELEQSPSEM